MNQCEVNERFGIIVGGESHPTLKTNICRDNLESGLFFTDSATGLVQGNQCENNGHDGIQVDGQAVPQIEFCTNRLNRRSGIAYFKKAGGHIITGPTMTNVMDIIIAIVT